MKAESSIGKVGSCEYCFGEENFTALTVFQKFKKWSSWKNISWPAIFSTSQIRLSKSKRCFKTTKNFRIICSAVFYKQRFKVQVDFQIRRCSFHVRKKGKTLS